MKQCIDGWFIIDIWHMLKPSWTWTTKLQAGKLKLIIAYYCNAIKPIPALECFFSIYTKPFMIRQFIMTFLEITIVFAGDLHKLGIKLGQLPTGCLGTGTIPPPPQAHPLEVNKSETCGYIHFHGGEILEHLFDMNSGCALFITFHYIIQ